MGDELGDAAAPPVSPAHVVVASEAGAGAAPDHSADRPPVACGALRVSGDGSYAEVQHIYVAATRRRRGVASSVLVELERWASELGLVSLVLQTNRALPGGADLFTKSGYTTVTNSSSYIDLESGVWLEKHLCKP